MNLLWFSFLGNTQFKVTVKSISQKEAIQIHVPELLDRNDGSFLMRYRMYGSAKGGLKVEVFYGDVPVAQSPYILKGTEILIVSFSSIPADTAVLRPPSIVSTQL